MNPHKLLVQICLSLIVVFSSAEICVSKQPFAIVTDERLSALRKTPELSGQLVRRLSRGRKVTIRSTKATPDGVVFLLVNVTTRTHGWIQREAIISPSRPGDDQRLVELINSSHGFDRIARARIFLDHFPRSPLRPQVLLLLSTTAEEHAAKLSRDAAKRLKDTTESAPEFTYFLNYTGLDRYNRQRVRFVFDKAAKRFHYDGAALRELVRRYPKSPEAAIARSHLARLAVILK
ncbi:MAG: hypothetical protein LC794_02915 [Acidobacteria bacterium]|nr:hypothetical protein [Acidobacteriota bacterium]